MFDVNQITTTLRGLPDRILQQYAMMNKGNPYILSLAVAESNQRKQLRTAAQARMAMPRPKVADAAIAGMTEAPAVDAMGNVTGMAAGGLPEDYGIGRLPARNIERMADGGIAGYGDGDDVPRKNGMAQGGMYDFAQRSEPVVRMSGGGVARYNGATGSVTGVSPELLSKYKQEATEMAMGTRMQFSPDVKAVVSQIQAAQEGSYLKEEQKQMLEGSPLRNKTQNLASMVAPTAPTVSAAYDPTENLKKIAQTNARYTTTSAPKNAEEAAMLNRYPATKPAVKKDDAVAAPGAGGVTDLLPTVGAGASFAPSKAPTTEDAAALGDKFFNSKTRIGEINRQVLQEQMDASNAKENSIAALEAFNKKQGPAYAGYEAALKKEELQDATDKEKAGLQALFKGFLAIAAGESPNAATNIAKGSMAGLEEYSGAMKEFKKSAKERNKEMQFIAQARRAEERGDFDKVQMYEDKANTAKQAAARFGLSAINDITNAGGKASSEIYTTMLTNRSRENIAAMGENRADARALLPTGDARTAMMLGTGNTQAERLKSGMMVLQELSTDKSGAKTVEMLAKINSDRAKNGEAPISMADLVASAREYSALMYPKVSNEAPTRER